MVTMVMAHNRMPLVRTHQKHVALIIAVHMVAHVLIHLIVALVVMVITHRIVHMEHIHLLALI